ncbi:MAG: LD-carboxypeptidase [Gammaproteobacteria bacterium]|nr:LD-carboxypeptidase [Gammaproteobacteria bacterium]MDE0247396.1 LD-carboxypeptidase [Gammaproteobacteria bacterium]
MSPSWGGAGRFPHRMENGVRQLERLGFRVKLGRHALNPGGMVSDSAENRVSDLHEMFTDPDVRLILAAIGGDHSCHLLPLLDFDLIAENPKVLMGFSDITVLNVAIWCETGLVTINGPCLLTDFAEYPEMLEYTRSAFLRAVCEPRPIGRVVPSSWWTEEYLDWRTKKDLERARAGVPSAGWAWLKNGVAEGVLVGGCLESLQHLRGTRFWPSLQNAILFVETSGDAPAPARVDGMLMDYENMGVFSQLAGLLVGRPMGYSPAQRRELRGVLLERTHRFSFPVIMDMDFGHTAPQFVLPVGCRARIDSERRAFEIVEAAVS